MKLTLPRAVSVLLAFLPKGAAVLIGWRINLDMALGTTRAVQADSVSLMSACCEATIVRLTGPDFLFVMALHVARNQDIKGSP